MKRMGLTAAISLLLLLIASSASAATYTFLTSPPEKSWDIDRYNPSAPGFAWLHQEGAILTPAPTAIEAWNLVSQPETPRSPIVAEINSTGFDTGDGYDDNGPAMSVAPEAVPEPATLTLLGIGLLGAVAVRRRTKQ